MSRSPIPPTVSPKIPPERSPSKTMEELSAENVKSILALERAAQGGQSLGDRIANRITRFCGSMAFVWVHVLWFSVWIIANTILPVKPLDPYPYSFLTLVVSLEAIFLSTFIMISENRKGRIDERRSHLDLQINLLAEQEATKALQLLQQIAEKVGVDKKADSEVQALEEATSPEKLLQQIDQSVKEEKDAEEKAE